MTTDDVISEILERHGEYLEMTRSVDHLNDLVINILCQMVIKEREKMESFKKVNSCRH